MVCKRVRGWTLGRGTPHPSCDSKVSCLVPVIAVGTMAFDVRIGLYDDPPNKETVKMIEATKEVFRLLGVLIRGLESVLFRFVTTPNYRKFCEVQDISLEIGQRIVDDKVSELKKIAEEGEEFTKDGGEDCTLTHSHFLFSSLLKRGDEIFVLGWHEGPDDCLQVRRFGKRRLKDKEKQRTSSVIFYCTPKYLHCAL